MYCVRALIIDDQILFVKGGLYQLKPSWFRELLIFLIFEIHTNPIFTVLAVFSYMFVLNYIHYKEDKVAARNSRCNCILLGSEN